MILVQGCSRCTHRNIDIHNNTHVQIVTTSMSTSGVRACSVLRVVGRCLHLTSAAVLNAVLPVVPSLITAAAEEATALACATSRDSITSLTVITQRTQPC